MAQSKVLRRKGAKLSHSGKISTDKAPILPYRNPALSPEKRVKDLLSRMKLEEKAAQMLCIWQKKPQTLVDNDGNFDLPKAKKAFKDGHGLGQVGRPSDAGKRLNARRMAELTNAIQRFFLENTRLGIPVVFHEECLHGHAAVDATSFPQPIALAATFNTDLTQSIFATTALEARSRGTRHLLLLSMSFVTPAGDASRRPTERIPSWFRKWVWRQSAGCRVTPAFATRQT